MIIENLIRLVKERRFKEVEKEVKRIFSQKIETGQEDQILNILAVSYINRKLFIKAKDALENSINLNDGNFNSHYNYAVVCFNLGQYDKAIEAIEKSLKLNSSFSNSFIIKAKCLAKTNIKKLNLFVAETIKHHERNFFLLFELGNIFFELDNFFEAENIYLKIYSFDENKNNILLLVRIAACYESRHLLDEALNFNLRAIKLNPNFIDALLNISNLYRSKNDNDNALQYLEKVFNIAPYNVEAHRYYSVIHKYKNENDAHLQKMLAFEKNSIFSKLENKNKAILYFALSKAFEDLKKYDQTFYYLKKGNEFRRESIIYNEDHIRLHFSIMEKIPSKELTNNESSVTNINPIFIVGMPRSGTTLTEQIISSHSKVYSAGELYFFQNLIKKYFPSNDPDIFYNDFCTNFSKYRAEIAEEYVSSIKKFPIQSNIFVTDKNPFNFIFLGIIQSVFPNSKIIYCKRNAKDNCLSIYKNYFPMDGIGFAYDTSELANYYNLHVKLMSHWKEIFKNRIYTSIYENMISNIEIESKKIISFLKLEWEDSCLEFYKNKNIVKTLSTSQVREKIYTTSVNSWENYSKYIPELFSKLN